MSEHVLGLLQRHFMNREDRANILAPWNRPQPVSTEGIVEPLLRAHVLGRGAPAVTVTWKTHKRSGTTPGRWRIGAHTPAPDGTTRWLCIDLDGPGHASALADVVGVGRQIIARAAAVGITVYAEVSGSCTGMHLWVFFEPAIDAGRAQALGLALVPPDALLENGGLADARAGRGIEVFPKQTRIYKGGLGNAIWLPWWHGARPGGCQFYRIGDEVAQAPAEAGAATMPGAVAAPGATTSSQPGDASAAGATDDAATTAAADITCHPALSRYVPRELLTATAADIDRALAALPAPPPPGAPSTSSASSGATATQGSSSSSTTSNGTSDGANSTGATAGSTSTGSTDARSAERQLKDWRQRALAALRLEDVYGHIWVGRQNGQWHVVRDPKSETGDQNPSAGVADGSGGAERGSFHSFRNGKTISVFDFLTQYEGLANFRAARDRIADLSGVPVPDVWKDHEPRFGRRGAARVGADERPEDILGGSEGGSTAAHTSGDGSSGSSAAGTGGPGGTGDAGGDAGGAAGSGSKRIVPTIYVNHRQRREVIADGWSALHVVNRPPFLSNRAENLARLKPDDHGGMVIDDIDEKTVLGYLLRHANWMRVTAKGPFDDAPPRDVAPVMMRFIDSRIPPLDSIVHTPCFAASGRVVASPGYDREARLYYHAPSGFDLPPVPERPTATDVAAAKSLIFDDLLVDFPFVTQADRSHMLAALILPFVRRLINGVTPLHLIEAPDAGTGKGLLTLIIGWVITGRAVDTTTLAPSEEENKKILAAMLLRGGPITLFDNVEEIASGQLASALTSDPWSGRILGQTRHVAFSNKCLWLATGNNVRLSKEISRRCVRIRLDAKVDKPWERTGFKHPNLVSWVEENRAALVHGLLVMVQHWIALGCPPARTPKPKGSFEQWTRVIGGILDAVGVEGFLENEADLHEAADTEGRAWRAFVAAWCERFGSSGVSTTELVNLAVETDQLGQVLGDKGPRSQSSRLGRALMKQRDRIFGGFRIEGREGRSHQMQWWLTAISSPGAATADAAVAASAAQPPPQPPSPPQATANQSPTTIDPGGAGTNSPSPQPATEEAAEEVDLDALDDLEDAE